MWDFLTYDLKSAAIVAAYYLLYRTLLCKEPFHRLNRSILLAIEALSVILPACAITIHGKADITHSNLNNLAAVTVQQGPFADLAPWKIAAVCIFVSGAILILAKMAISIASICVIVRKGKKKLLENGKVLVITEKKIPPFSWFKYIVATEEDSKQESIMIHENAHVTLHHSSDMMIANLLAALQWFNPAIWMLRKDLRAIHEYEADEVVLNQGKDMKEYQLMLIGKAMGNASYSVANSLNDSTLKNRINMMYAEKPPFPGKLKALYLIPMIALSLAANANTVYDREETVADRQEARRKQNKANFTVVGKTGTYEVWISSPKNADSANSGNADCDEAGVGQRRIASQQGKTAFPKGTIIYIDGKKTTLETATDIDAGKILSIDVAKKGNDCTIRIKTK